MSALVATSSIIASPVRDEVPCLCLLWYHVPDRRWRSSACAARANVEATQSMITPVRAALRRTVQARRRAAATAILLLPLAASNVTAVAQTPSEPGPLVLGTLFNEARRASPRAEAARALARAAEARVPSTRRLPDPQVQFGLMNYTLRPFAPMDEVGMRQLQLMQMIPIPGRLGLSGNVASAQASAVAHGAVGVEWDVRRDVAMSFYDLYETDQKTVVIRNALGLLQDIASTANAIYAVGEGRQADVLRARLEIARMVEDTIRMRAMRTGIEARLNALLGRVDDVPIGRVARPVFPDALPSLDSLTQSALANRPMLRAGQDELRAATAASRVASRQIVPDLQLGLQYAQRPAEQRGTDHMGSFMVGASLPIFARSRQLRLRDEAGAMQAMAAAELGEMRADTRALVIESYANLDRARRLTALYRTTILPQATAAVASAMAAYRVGRVDFMTLLDNRMTVNRYWQEMAVLEADEGRAWAELEMLTGRQLVDPASSAPPSTRGLEGP